MLADVVHLALLHDQDGVRFHQRRQTVRDGDDGAPLGDAVDVGVDDGLGLGVERAGGLVEDEDLRVGDQRPGDGEALALAARQVRRALIDLGLVASGQLLDELFGAGEPGRVDHLVEGGVRFGDGDVGADGAGEQEVLLQHDAERRAQVGEVVLAHVDAVDLEQARVVGVEPLDQAGDGRLARARAAHDAQRRALRDLERHLLQRGLQRPLVGEQHLGELDVASDRVADAVARAALFGEAD